MTDLTRGMVSARVKTLHDNACAQRPDHEALHGTEDKLWRDVLMAIAQHRCPDPAGCAEEALKTQGIDFERSCA